MRYLIIIILLISVSCQQKADANRITEVEEIKEEWHPGSKYNDTTRFNRCSPKGYFVPFRKLGMEKTSYEELCRRYGEPEDLDECLLVNGRADDSYYDEDGNPINFTCAMLYDYVNPAVADSLFRDKECAVRNVVWRAGVTPDDMYVMYLRLYFVRRGDDWFPIWGYKGIFSDVYSYF